MAATLQLPMTGNLSRELEIQFVAMEDPEEAEVLENGDLGKTSATAEAHVKKRVRGRGEPVLEELDVEEAPPEVWNAKSQAANAPRVGSAASIQIGVKC